MRAIHKIAVLGVAVVAFGTIGMGAALADPPSTPSLDTLVGVGSDTITPLFAGSPTENTSPSIVTDYNATNPQYGVASWDAVNPTTGASGDTITLKAANSSDTSCSTTRPDGSSAGITALNDNQTDTNQDSNGQTVYCIDYSRSSRAPNAGTTDTFVSLASDAINWSYPMVPGESSPQPASLTLADLQAIYTCQDTNWDEVGGSNAPIVPVLPQTGSGTRSTFLGALGISSSTTESCWINGEDPFSTASTPPVIEENTGLSAGNEDVFDHSGSFDWPLGQTTTTADSADVVYPYSIGDWIAQGSPVTGTGTAGTAGGATVGGHASSIWGQGDSSYSMAMGETVNDILGTAEEPITTNSFGQPVINYSNWEPQLTRTLYAVVRNGCPSTGACFPTTPTLDATGLPALFGPNGWFCTNGTAQADVVSYGFLNLGGNCGTLTPGT
jgi:ABC-type phosphate transport system substrate-binding protein